jgi:hypothetical protein
LRDFLLHIPDLALNDGLQSGCVGRMTDCALPECTVEEWVPTARTNWVWGAVDYSYTFHVRNVWSSSKNTIFSIYCLSRELGVPLLEDLHVTARAREFYKFGTLKTDLHCVAYGKHEGAR